LEAEHADDRLAAAEAALAAGRHHEALARFREVTTDRDPTIAARGWYGLGYLALTAQEIDGAVTLFTEAARTDPTHANASYQLGRIAAQRGQGDRALRRFYATLAIEPDHQGALSGIRSVLDHAAPDRAPETPPVSRSCDRCGAARIPAGRFCDRCGAPYDAIAAAPVAEPPSDRPPRPPRWRGSIVGVVTSVGQRMEAYRGRPASITILDLRLEPRDTAGRPGPPIALHMRGMELRGTVAAGDWIEVPRQRGGDASRPKVIWNLTTGASVEVKKRILMA
jgi:tetratricopeptide (TPR) repeat protein